MKSTFKALSLLSLSLLAGCSSEMADTPARYATVIITANAPAPTTESRSAIDQTQYSGGVTGILWTPDDCIGVYGLSTVNARFDNVATEAMGRTQFTGTFDEDDELLYAYYPYHAENDGLSDFHTLSGNLPAVQEYDLTSRMIDGDYKVGKPRFGADNEFDFTHIFALARITISGSVSDLSGEVLKSIELVAPSGRSLAGAFTFSADGGDYTFTEGSSTLTINFAQPHTIASNTNVTAYASIAPELNNGDKITISLTTSKHIASFTAEVTMNFEPNHLYNFNLSLPSFANEAHGFTVEELPVEETANCYMITSAGAHDFCATVIGNGEKGIIKGVGFHTEDPYISPVSAGLLWQDVDGFVKDVTLGSDGRVHYTTTGNVGNAVIAVYDAQGEVLWSWHIWGVGDTLPADVEVTNRNGAVASLMDRTLGAWSPTSLNVTMYQWGRKDPFPGALTYYTVDGEKDIETSFPVYSGSELTYANAVKHPDEIFNFQTSNFEENQRYLWGDNDLRGIYTNPPFGYPNYLDSPNATAEVTAGWTDVKTIYDPSPAGYRIPNKFTFTGFVSNSMGTNASAGNTRLTQVNYVKYDNGYYFKCNSEDTKGVFFPQAGSRSGSTGSLWVGGNAPYITRGYTVSYWNSAPQSNSGQAQKLGITGFVEFNTGLTTSNSNNTVATLDFMYVNNVYPVRCVRE